MIHEYRVEFHFREQKKTEKITLTLRKLLVKHCLYLFEKTFV